MKRLLTFFLICFSFVEYTRAKDIIDYKYWDEGKLTWDDFPRYSQPQRSALGF